jgi:hypothetical protein
LPGVLLEDRHVFEGGGMEYQLGLVILECPCQVVAVPDVT